MKSKKLTISLMIFALLFMNNLAAIASTAPKDADLKQLRSDIESATGSFTFGDCKTLLMDRYDLETVEFLKFLEDNFQNKSSSSSLINTAIVRYKNYKDKLAAIFEQLKPRQSSFNDLSQFDQQYASYLDCSEITNAYVDLAKQRMILHVKTNSYQKKATVMLEKYQAINAKMRDLHFSVAQMYSLFVAFKNKLPGFLQKCISS